MEYEEIQEHAYVTCPQCHEKFLLVWNDYSFGDKKQTLFVRSSPSGGVYDVLVRCPHCDLEESL